MKNSILTGALVLAMALTPSLASATNTAYAVDIGMRESYLAPGLESVEPTLSQTAGSAEISNKLFLGTQWLVEVHCFDNSAVDCVGNIVS